MQSLNLSGLDIAAKTALQRILRPRFLNVVEPWVLRASADDRRLAVRLLRTVEQTARDAEWSSSGSALKMACVVNENGVHVPIAETSCSIDALQVSPSPVRSSAQAPRPRSAPASVNLRTSTAAEIYSMNFQRLSVEPSIHRMCQQWVMRSLEIYQVAVHNRADATAFLHLLRGIYAFAESLGSLRPRTANSSCTQRLFEDSKVGRLVVEATAATIQHRLQESERKKKAVVIVGRRNIPATYAPHVVKTKPLQPNNVFLSANRVPGTMQTTYSRDFKPVQAISWRS
jgi:hypothetical protein